LCIRNMPGGGCSAPASTDASLSRPDSFVWFLKRDLASSISSTAAWRSPTPCPTTCTVPEWRSSGSGGRRLRHWRSLPDPADHGLRAGGERRVHDAAGAQGGIIPGAANLRMAALHRRSHHRQAIQYERKLPCDSRRPIDLRRDRRARPDGQRARQGDRGLTSSGAVSAVSNRRPSVSAKSRSTPSANISRPTPRPSLLSLQSALIANLEREWNAHNRKV